jgi:hypothetical protein
METPLSDGPLWARRLANVCAAVRRDAGDPSRNAAWQEAWILLNAGLGR